MGKVAAADLGSRRAEVQERYLPMGRFLYEIVALGGTKAWDEPTDPIVYAGWVTAQSDECTIDGADIVYASD